MNNFSFQNAHPHKKNRLWRFLLFLLALFSAFLFTSCRKSIDYFDYVSELRNNIFLAKSETLSLRIYAVTKENPYQTDGVKQVVSSRFEAYLVAPEGNQATTLSFQIGERTFGGEMSYDNVKGEYFYSCTLDVAEQTSIPCTIVYGDAETVLTAKSVLTAHTLSPKIALEKLIAENRDYFDSLTDKYGFAGEIYLRLIYEESPYYYFGVIDRTGKMHAFLMNAETGKVLAHRGT